MFRLNVLFLSLFALEINPVKSFTPVEPNCLFARRIHIRPSPRGIDETRSVRLEASLGPFRLFGPRRPKSVTFGSLDGGNAAQVSEAAQFFTGAFWAGKVGGVDELTPAQSGSLTSQQSREFRSRYGPRMGGAGERALLVARDDEKNVLMGCAGVQIDRIGDGRGKAGGEVVGPLMSNVAVGRSYRRMGVAEDLVKQTEDLVKSWGYGECYLLVEKRNTPAIRLYRKLGYRALWEDSKATTLVPKSNGAVSTEPTTLVCMMKRVTGLGALFTFLPF